MSAEAIAVGRVREIMRYPVKSMAGVPVDSAELGWHGLAGDRRFAIRRVEADNGFPWLSASRLPEMLLYQPFGLEPGSAEPLSTHVRAPDGSEFELGRPDLDAHFSELAGEPVELMRLKHGVFDEAAVSVIDAATIARIGREAGLALDPRRFRANVLLETESGVAFGEDEWVGSTLAFGNREPRAAVTVTLRDLRCSMIDFDPDTAERSRNVMKTAVRLNENFAGVYATAVRAGTIRVGDRVRLLRAAV